MSTQNDPATATPGQTYRSMKAFVRILAQCIEDYEYLAAMDRPIYNLDFSLLRPFLFSRAEANTNPFYPGALEVATHLLSHHDGKEPYVFAVSGAVYYEFMDAIHHVVSSAKNVANMPTSAVKEFFENEALKKSDHLVSELSLLTKPGLDIAIVKPAEKLLSLIKEQKVSGLGDFTRGESPIQFDLFRDNYERILNFQQQRRIANDRTRRPDADSIFHYKMDVINICLSLYCQDLLSAKTLFVTPTVTNLLSCKTDEAESMGRHCLAALFMKNVHTLHRVGHCDNVFDFLADALMLATRIVERLRLFETHDSWDKVPTHLRNQLLSYGGNFHALLINTAGLPTQQTSVSFVEDMKDVFSSKERLQNRVDEIEASAIEVANKVTREAASFGLEQLEEFPLDDDPILARIKKTLRIP